MTHSLNGSTAFPVRTDHFCCDSDDISTDYLLCAYADCVMVTVTQTESFGTVFQSRCMPESMLLQHVLFWPLTAKGLQGRHKPGWSSCLQYQSAGWQQN